jgi:hypothetical protein
MQNLEPGTQNLESVPAGRGSGRDARDTEFQVQGSRFQIPDPMIGSADRDYVLNAVNCHL